MHQAQPSNKRLFIGKLVLFALLVVWNLSALDLPLARWLGTPSGVASRLAASAAFCLMPGYFWLR